MKKIFESLKEQWDYFVAEPTEIKAFVIVCALFLAKVTYDFVHAIRSEE